MTALEIIALVSDLLFMIMVFAQLILSGRYYRISLYTSIACMLSAAVFVLRADAVGFILAALISFTTLQDYLDGKKERVKR